jgi:hypothetical protein
MSEEDQQPDESDPMAPPPEDEAASAAPVDAQASYTPPEVTLADPGMYVCDDPSGGGIHPALGQIQPGENDFTGATMDDQRAALAALVEAGVLKKA